MDFKNLVEEDFYLIIFEYFCYRRGTKKGSCDISYSSCNIFSLTISYRLWALFFTISWMYLWGLALINGIHFFYIFFVLELFFWQDLNLIDFSPNYFTSLFAVKDFFCYQSNGILSPKLKVNLSNFLFKTQLLFANISYLQLMLCIFFLF